MKEKYFTTMSRDGRNTIFTTKLTSTDKKLLETVLSYYDSKDWSITKKIYLIYKISGDIPYFYPEYYANDLYDVVSAHVPQVVGYMFRDYRVWLEGVEEYEDEYVKEVIKRWRRPEIEEMLEADLGQQLAELRYSLIEMPKEFDSSSGLEVWKNFFISREYLPFVEYDPNQRREVPVLNSSLCFIRFPEHVETFAKMHDLYLEILSEHGIKIQLFSTRKFKYSGEYNRILNIGEAIKPLMRN